MKSLVDANKPLAGVMGLVLNTAGHKGWESPEDPKGSDENDQTPRENARRG